MRNSDVERGEIDGAEFRNEDAFVWISLTGVDIASVGVFG